ncbi:hypothetical protein PAHAL_2G260300 [Panicum hallii]|uniref:C2H2-type domain-containing protein n=1 Tax=Panicum hallii TaxID=206008 RepID=A0A2T8KQD1_9POAL|nr:hypothetical protein PAHAL_2G260300 [Panicum hallii]
MERDDGRHTKLQQLPHSSSFSTAAFAWPPPQVRRSSSSSHTCEYCKREFRSAQGLGGHMNVHRLDRARLIHHQCSSHRPAALAPPPNPNPSSTVLDLLGSGCPCCRRAHGAAASNGGSAVPAVKLGICRFSSALFATTTQEFEVKNLELRRGACSHGDGTEEILDLELRIGYS